MALRAVSSRQAFHLKASAGDPASDLVLRVQKSLRTTRLKLEHAQQATLLSKLRAKPDCPKQAGVETAEKLLGKDDLFDPEDVPTWCIASLRAVHSLCLRPVGMQELLQQRALCAGPLVSIRHELLERKGAVHQGQGTPLPESKCD